MVLLIIDCAGEWPYLTGRIGWTAFGAKSMSSRCISHKALGLLRSNISNLLFSMRLTRFIALGILSCFLFQFALPGWTRQRVRKLPKVLLFGVQLARDRQNCQCTHHRRASCNTMGVAIRSRYMHARGVSSKVSIETYTCQFKYPTTLTRALH